MQNWKKLLTRAAIFAALSGGAVGFFNGVAEGARTDEVWQERLGTWIEVEWAEGRDVLIRGIDKYLNFGFDSGTNGYGFRDNGGTMEFKNSGGAWTAFGSGGGGGTIGTSTDLVNGRVVFATGADTVGTDSTFLFNSSADRLSFTWASSTGITATSFFGSLVGNADTATALAANGSNCSAGSFPLGVNAAGAAESCTDAWTEAENTAANYEQGLTAGDGLTRTGDDFDCDTANGSTFGCLSAADWTTFNNSVDTSLTLTVAGTANQITSSAGAQDLSANRTWTLSLPNHVIFPSSFQASRASTTNATSTNLDITGLFTFNGVTASTWAAFCTTITGGAGLCDGNDATGGGGAGAFATSSSETSGRVPFYTSTAAFPALISGGSANFRWDNALNTLYLDNGTTTATTTIMGYGLPSIVEAGTTYYAKAALRSDDPNVGAAMIMEHNATDCPLLGCGIWAYRSRGDRNTKSVVQNNDYLFALYTGGHDGTDYAPAAAIRMEVDGTPGNNDMPGRIVFETSADGAQTPTEHLRINNAGLLSSHNATTTLFTATTAWLTNLFIGADTIAEYIADTVGSMLTGNTETDITVTYDDTDNTVDFVVDTLPNLTGTLDIDSGGTGTTTSAAGYAAYWGSSSLLGTPTTTASCSSGASCTGFTIFGSSPISISTTLGTNITAAEIADGDHGDFTYSGGLATIDANAVALGTDTTGDYTAGISSSGSITVGNGTGEGASATVNLNMGNANSWTALQTFANSSTTLASFGYASSTVWRGGGLTSDCDTAATSKLLWDATTGQFSCGTDQTGAGGGVWPFTPSTYNGQSVQATSTGLWLTGAPYSLIASSTLLTGTTTQMGSIVVRSDSGNPLALDVMGDTYPVFQSVRSTSVANAARTALSLVASTSADMIDGFAVDFDFVIRDVDNVANPIALLRAIRSGADNSGILSFITYNAGVQSEKMRIMPSGRVGIASTTPMSLLGTAGTTTTYTLNVDNPTHTGTSTHYIRSNTAAFGGEIILEDMDGAGCTSITALNGVLYGNVATCPADPTDG